MNCIDPAQHIDYPHLKTQLAAAERTIAELRDTEATWRLAMTDAQDRADRMQRERDEARRVAVWVAINSHRITHRNGVVELWDQSGKGRSDFEHDGTDAGILAALRRAKGDSDGR